MSCIVHPRLVAQTRIDTPLGPMLLAATAAGLAGAWFDGQKHHPGVLQLPVEPRQRHLAAAAAALKAYWSGAVAAPLELALDLPGTAFQRRVWQALCAIDAGQTRSYGQVAAAAGLAHAARAAGAAIGRNPVSVIVPCHRVLGHDGRLTGYAGGLPRKRALLQHEGALPSAHRSVAAKSSMPRRAAGAGAAAAPDNPAP